MARQRADPDALAGLSRLAGLLDERVPPEVRKLVETACETARRDPALASEMLKSAADAVLARARVR